MNCMNSLVGSIQQSQPRCIWSRARFGSQNYNLLMNYDYCVIVSYANALRFTIV
jgi:hypothetical protein